ncbi:MAG: hypothetical protein ABL982_05495 [Vicinamibacterales bacterium]
MRQTILYFGNTWFTENRTSSHHIARWLGRRHDVYYFECPGLRAPKGSTRDLRKVLTQLRRAMAPAVDGAEGVKVRPLLQIPFHRLSLVRRLNTILMRATIGWFMWRRGIKTPIVWCTVPHVASLAKSIPASTRVYYCVDDYSAVPGVDAEAVRLMDAMMTANADVVFVTSETLVESKKHLNPETHASPHGVDVEHFKTAMLPPAPLPDIGMPRQPVIGYFGLVEHYTDLDLLAWLASQRPEWTFLVIGHVVVPAATLPQRPNLLFVGPKPYESLPEYGRHFTAAIIPYRVTDFTYHANPLKLREYLAMGKRIVATSTPQIDRFKDIVDVVKTPDEWLTALDRIVSTPQSAADIDERRRRVQDWSWDARINRAWGIVEDKMRRATPR